MALERRFEKLKMLPNSNMLKKILILNGFQGTIAERIIVFFNELQDKFENRIGHAYFNNAKDNNTLDQVWSYEILPVIEKEFEFRE